MRRNVAGQYVGIQLVSKTDGSAVTSGTTTVYVTGDAGTQAAGSVGSGACTHEGNGYWTYAPAQAETNYTQVAFTFVNTSAVNSTVQIFPVAYDASGQFTGVALAADQAVNTTKFGGTTVTGRDIGASVLLSSGTGTGQISFTSGVVQADAAKVGGQTASASGTITFPAATLASTTNITAGTITTATNLTNERAKYMHGAVWVGTAANVNTASYVDGIMTNPVSTIAAAKSIADNLGLKRFWVQSGVGITLGAAYVGYYFTGAGYTLALGGQDISKSILEKVEGLSGTGICTTGECIVYDSQLGAITIGEVDFLRCHLMGTVTMSQASVPYRFHDCTGISSAKITFSAASQTAVMSQASGAFTIAGMTLANQTLYIDGDCDVTLDATNSAGTVYICGNVRLTNLGAGQTINDTARWDETQNITNVTGNVTGSVGSVTGAVGSVTGAVGSVTGAVGSVTGNVGGNVVGSVASVTGAVGSVTGNIGGNLAGSVGSVTGAVGSVTGNVGGSVGSVTGAVGSVTGNVGGNVTGSVGSIATGGIAAASFAAGAIDAAAIAANAIGASELAADAANEIADALLDRADSIETGLTIRQAARLWSAALSGDVAGAGGTTVTIKNAIAAAKTRITATVDASGNRTVTSTDLT